MHVAQKLHLYFSEDDPLPFSTVAVLMDNATNSVKGLYYGSWNSLLACGCAYL